MSQSILSALATHPMRLDAFIASVMDIKSRVKAQQFIRAGCVSVNKKIVRKTSQQLKENDEVVVKIDEQEYMPVAVPKGAMDALTVLYEDDDCLIINKPAGIAVHRGNSMQPDEITLIDVLRQYFADHRLPFSESEVLVHRLDKETTGCLLIAKNPKAHLALQKLFETRQISKTYLALVAGVPSPAKALIDSPIGRHLTHRTKMSVMQTGKTRVAKTSYETLACAQGTALLSCDLLTGRTHQIRVHMASVGHPILGDATYHTGTSKKLASELEIDFLCLHAWKLSFVSPFTEKNVSVVAPVAKPMEEILNRLEMTEG